MPAQHPDLLEPSPYESDEGILVGRDPRRIEAGEWLASDLPLDVGLTTIRRKCLDCGADNAAEVRKCVCTDCPLWPLRMDSNPAGFKEVGEIGGAQRERQPVPPALQKAPARAGPSMSRPGWSRRNPRQATMRKREAIRSRKPSPKRQLDRIGVAA